MSDLTPDLAVLNALSDRFEHRYEPDEVAAFLARAADDLRGSVNEEALPEMAVRLAAVRMERAERPGAAGSVSP
jgi:hypothetical protein